MIWRKVYRVTKSFPAREVYSLADQIRRAAVSIPSDIAEGAGRHTKKEFVNYLHVDQGLLSGLDTQSESAKPLLSQWLSRLIRHQSPNS